MMAVFIGIVSVVFRNEPQGGTPVRSVSEQLPHNIDVALKKARFSEIQDGLLVWELVAERVDYDKVGETAFLSDIRMEFQHTLSHGSVMVTADSGEYSSAAKTVRLKGHVTVVTEDGARFNTNSIVYSGSTAQFSTVDPVVFRHQRLQLAAVGMELSVKNLHARFFSSIDASIISR